jgi:hypothetical protein
MNCRLLLTVRILAIACLLGPMDVMVIDSVSPPTPD